MPTFLKANTWKLYGKRWTGTCPEAQDKLKDHEEKRFMNNVESGNIDAVKDTNSTTVDTSLPESKPIVPH